MKKSKRGRLFFNQPTANEVGEPSDFILVKDSRTSAGSWANALKQQPYVVQFGHVEVAVRADKSEDCSVMMHVLQLLLIEQPVNRSQAQQAALFLVAAKAFIRTSLTGAAIHACGAMEVLSPENAGKSFAPAEARKRVRVGRRGAKS